MEAAAVERRVVEAAAKKTRKTKKVVEAVVRKARAAKEVVAKEARRVNS